MLQQRDNIPTLIRETRAFFKLRASEKDAFRKGVNWNDPSNWLTLDEIPDGVPFGFAAFHEGSGFVLIDFDHVFVNGELIPAAKKILDRLLLVYGYTYCEVSQSGTGLHAIIHLEDYADNFGPESNGDEQIILFDMSVEEYRRQTDADKTAKDRIPKVEIFFREGGRHCFLTGNVYREKHEVLSGEAAAGMFFELLKIRDEQHRKFDAGEYEDYTAPVGDISFEDRERVMDALPWISAAEYNTWIHVGIALYRSGFSFGVWDTWSQYSDQRKGNLYDGYTSDGNKGTEYKWKSFEKSSSRWSIGTIFYLAKKAGWIDPGIIRGFEPFDPFDVEPVLDVPPFPVDCLPKVLRDFVVDTAKVLEVPVDMPACQVLAVLAAACADKFTIKLGESWDNLLNLYVICAAAPGEGKSKTLSHCREPLDEWVEQENRLRMPAIRKSRLKLEILEAQLKQLKSEMKSSGGKRSKDGVNKTPTLEDLIDKESEIQREKEDAPREITFLVDDVTPEALATVMDNNGGFAAVLTPEGGFADVLAGRYDAKGTPNLELVNKAYDGEPYRAVRVTRAKISLPRPVLTCGMFVQPDVVREIISNDKMRGRGFVSRFLYAMPVSNVGFRKLDDLPFNKEVVFEYRELFNLIRNFTAGGVIRLSSEAAEVFSDYRKRWVEPRLCPNGEFGDFADVASRNVGNVGRIMGLCHIAELERRACDWPVSKEEAENAVQIGKYFMQHFAAVYRSPNARDARNIRDAKYILEKIKSDMRAKRADCANWEISLRDLRKLCRRWNTAEEMQPALETLIKRGYLRIDSPKKSRTKTVVVNPDAFKD